MATTLKQIQTQKQKLAPRQVLQARLLQLNTVNLEQAIIKELEQNPLLEQVDSEDPQVNEEVEEGMALPGSLDAINTENHYPVIDAEGIEHHVSEVTLNIFENYIKSKKH